MGTGHSGAMWDEIVQANKMIERVRPKSGTETGAGQHGAQGISDGLMGTFAGPILVGGVGTSELGLITKVGESIKDFATAPEFSTTIHPNVLSVTCGCIVGEPLIQPIHRRGFGGECATNQSATEMVGDQNVAGFAVVTDQVIETLGVGALLDHESEIDAETLKTLGSCHGVGVSTWSLAKLRSHADSALIDGIGEGQSRHATGVLV